MSILGAGVEIGSGGDNFDWMDAWRVVAVPEVTAMWTTAPLPAGDGLLVAKTESASGLIGWVKQKPRCQQLDD